MKLSLSALAVLATVSGLSVACGGSDKGNTGDNLGGGGSGGEGGSGSGCAEGEVQMGGACIPLGPGAVPCATMPNSGYDGDTQCLSAPDPSIGMQMHYGPTNYDDPEELSHFTIAPGDEYVDCMFMKTPNENDIHMSDYHVRLRPGTHHMITYVQPQEMPDSVYPEACHQGATFTFLVGATAPNTDISGVGAAGAPEYEGAAMTIKAKSQAAVQMHFINTTDRDRLKEGWINALYMPDDQVKMEVNPITWLGGIGMSIGPHTHVVTQGGSTAQVQISSCTVDPAQAYNPSGLQDGDPGFGDLNIIATVAHAHSHTSRVAAFIQRAGSTERQKFYEDYNWEEPTFVYYNSKVKNPMFDPVTKTTGGLTGQLVAHPGDQLSWECEVNNDSDNLTLKFSDLALTGEMCNVFGVYGPAMQPWSCISL
ncbi:MAG TPA: hypothetical protein VHE30_25880 [Polyangiaceae bacterium]|nr:hypothetical protein [Polyangiaceae bacterium]